MINLGNQKWICLLVAWCTKCTNYASHKPDPDAYHVNAFSLCWLNLNSYIFPKFRIVGRVVAKLAQDCMTPLVIVPRWQMQPWFPQFVGLVKPGTAPLLIPAHQHLLQLPGINLEPAIWDWLSLEVAILLGDSQNRDCHLTSSRSSEHHGAEAHSQHTTHQCNDSWTSATDSSLIPTEQLLVKFWTSSTHFMN